VALGLVLAFAAPAPAAEPSAPEPSTGGRNCMGEPRSRVLLTEGLYFTTSPLGVEDQLQLGVCAPLIRKPGLLFDYTNVQGGAIVHLSPVSAMPGAYVSVAPLSVLDLRAEAEGVAVWPIGRDAAGYFPLAGPNASIEELPASQARSATGFTATFTGTLQVEVAVAEAWTVAAVDSAAYSYWRLGDAAFYYNPRHDLAMARSDWIGTNTALLLAGHPISDRVKIQAGVTDELTWVVTAGSRKNILAGLVAAVISRWPGPRSETQTFLRVGAYTDHPFRTGELQLLAGVGVTFDLGSGGGPHASPGG
jgi:hypothetical protein